MKEKESEKEDGTGNTELKEGDRKLKYGSKRGNMEKKRKTGLGGRV